MIRNYIITSYRFIVKSKTYTLLNLAGLVSGLAVSFILLIFTINEQTYDRYVPGSTEIYRLLNRNSRGETHALTTYSLAPSIGEITPGITQTARLANPAYLTGPVLVKGPQGYMGEPYFYCADPSFLRLFDIEMTEGDRDSCLQKDRSVIISDQAAETYFPGTNPVGRELTIRTAGITYTMKITGVFKAMPWNSTLEMNFISVMGVYPDVLSNLFDSTQLAYQLDNDPSIETFIALKPASDPISAMISVNRSIRDVLPFLKGSVYLLQNIGDIYLGSAQVFDMVHKKGNRSNTYIYLALAAFVLLLAGINYSILSTARSALRYKEIGVRKVMGATRRALSAQILTESVLLTFLSFPVSYLLIGIFEPLLQWLFGYRIEVYSTGTLILLPVFAAITLFIGLISGAYIAVYLSSLNPIDALKNKLSSHHRINLSRVFTVVQLVITLSLLISVMTINRQVRFCLAGEQGIEQQNLMVISFDPNQFHKYTALKKAVAGLPGVAAVSGASINPPDIAVSKIPMKMAQGDRTVNIESIRIDTGFFRTLGVEIIEGKDFSPNDVSPAGSGFIINEETAVQLNIKSIKRSDIGGRPVLAIVRNFNVHTMYDPINPTLFIYQPETCRALLVRVVPGKMGMVKAGAEKAWKDLAPDMAFRAVEFSEALELLYRKERSFGYIVTGFTLLAFIVMGMGLFGLALLISERKVKETAIRKIFGATNTRILWGMQKEFLGYVLVASAIAVPVTWVALERWLGTFNYRVSIPWWIFVSSALIVTVFVSSIIFTRTLKVLNENPVKALKYE